MPPVWLSAHQLHSQVLGQVESCLGQLQLRRHVCFRTVYLQEGHGRCAHYILYSSRCVSTDGVYMHVNIYNPEQLQWLCIWSPSMHQGTVSRTCSRTDVLRPRGGQHYLQGLSDARSLRAAEYCDGLNFARTLAHHSDWGMESAVTSQQLYKLTCLRTACTCSYTRASQTRGHLSQVSSAILCK